LAQSKGEQALDPLDADRLILRDMEGPMTDVLYWISEGFELGHACLRANVRQDEFSDWADQPNNAEFYEKARALGIAKYQHELRNVALGVTTRRSQMPAMKIQMERLGISTKQKRTDSKGKDRAVPNGSNDIEADLDELEKAAGYDDE